MAGFLSFAPLVVVDIALVGEFVLDGLCHLKSGVVLAHDPVGPVGTNDGAVRPDQKSGNDSGSLCKIDKVDLALDPVAEPGRFQKIAGKAHGRQKARVLDPNADVNPEGHVDHRHQHAAMADLPGVNVVFEHGKAEHHIFFFMFDVEGHGQAHEAIIKSRQFKPLRPRTPGFLFIFSHSSIIPVYFLVPCECSFRLTPMTIDVKRKFQICFLVMLTAAPASTFASLAAEQVGEGGTAAPALPDRIDDLFEDLQNAPEGFDARVTEKTILNVFAQSGSATADLLMDRAASAILDDDLVMGLALLNRVTELQPDFAEGFHRRSQVFFQQEDYTNAMVDLQQVLRLEPRHFVAIRSLGFVLLETGDEEGALTAFRMALALNPHMEDVQQAIKKLSPDVEGRGI